MTWRPELTVAAVVQHDDRFLLVEERIQRALVVNQPAGHVEDGESILDAVMRETLEETGWHFSPSYLLGLYLWRNPDDGVSILRVAVVGEVFDHDPSRPLDDGIVAARWMRREELLRGDVRLRSPLVLRCIDDFLAGRRHDLSALNHLDAAPIQAA
jgi:8-oxo-dGTP pyrophosphatase MutT (NUDIX family)